MWERIRRSGPGWGASAGVKGADSNANASVSSLRKKIAPSRRSCSSVDWSTFGVPARRSGVLVMVTFAVRPDTDLVNPAQPGRYFHGLVPAPQPRGPHGPRSRTQH